MKYYIDPEDRSVYAYEADGSQDDYIKEGLVPLSDEELAVIRAEQEAARAPTPEQVLNEAMARRDELLGIATLHIAPLQDAVDLDDASLEEAAALKRWKQYRIAVNRVSAQTDFPSTITWPVQPTE